MKTQPLKISLQQSNDFLFSTFALIVSAILVHAVYVVQIRPRAEREKPTSDETPHDPDAELEARIKTELEANVTDLSELTARITREVPRESRFVLAGRIAQIVARLTRPIAQRERPWVATGDDLQIEEWAVRRAEREA